MVTFSSCKSTPQIDYDTKADHRIVFVGNSFTYANKLDFITQQLIKQLENQSVFTFETTSGGYKSVDHLSDALKEGTPQHELFMNRAVHT